MDREPACMTVSICIATRNHAPLLKRTLESIIAQGFTGEIIISDDGSTDDTAEMLKDYPVIYFHRLNNQYHNGVWGKNSSLRSATGDIAIQQSDDVLWETPDLVAKLIGWMQRGEFRIATVYDSDVANGIRKREYTGPCNPRPLFFLGAAWREDVCKVGGYDPDFADVIWYDDDWHAHGLMNGLGLHPTFMPVVGLHQDHWRPNYDWAPATRIYNEKVRKATQGESSWLSSGGSWPFVSGMSVNYVVGDYLGEEEAASDPQAVYL